MLLPHLHRRKPLPSNLLPSLLRNRRGPLRRIAGLFTSLYSCSPLSAVSLGGGSIARPRRIRFRTPEYIPSRASPQTEQL